MRPNHDKKGNEKMTRCYEFYAVMLQNPSFCDEKSDRTVDYINKYIRFMQEKGVKFDKTPEDKELFRKYQDEFGSEKAVTQPSDMTSSISKSIEPQLVAAESESIPAVCPSPQPLRECFQCGMGTRDTTEYKGQYYCPSCLETIQYRPTSKPTEETPKTETTILS